MINAGEIDNEVITYSDFISGTVEYNAVTHTLTLSNIYISASDISYGIQIASPADINVVFVGDNTIIGCDRGIYAGGSIAITGSVRIIEPITGGIAAGGEMITVSDGDITVIRSTNSNHSRLGIEAQSGSVRVVNSNIDISDNYCGIYAQKSIYIENDASNSVTISDYATGDNCALYAEGVYNDGNSCYDYGDVVITGGNYYLASENTNAIYAKNNVSIDNVNKMTVSAGYIGICAETGVVTLSDCGNITITASSGGNYRCGINTQHGGVNIINVNSLTVNGCIAACGDVIIENSARPDKANVIIKGGSYLDGSGQWLISIFVLGDSKSFYSLYLNNSYLKCDNGIDMVNSLPGASIVATKSTIEAGVSPKAYEIWGLITTPSSVPPTPILYPCIGICNGTTSGSFIFDDNTTVKCDGKGYKIENGCVGGWLPYIIFVPDDSDSPSQTSAQISFAEKYVEAVDGTMMPESEVYKYNDSLHAKEVAGIRNDVNDWRVICKTKLGKKGIKAYAYLDGNDSEELQALINKGYRIEYNWYRSTKSSKGYKFMYSTDDSSYYNTSVKTGTRYFYKCVITIYDQDGQIVRTILADCKAGYRLFKKNA